MWGNVAPRTDDDITDEAAGARRIELAAASKARKAAEKADRLKKNAELKQRLKSLEKLTDDQLDTEAAALARAEFAAKSKARFAAEAAERRRHQQEMEKRIKNTKARTDHEMDTEAAAIARAEHAARSRARKAAEETDLKAQTSALREKCQTTPSRTDNLMDTEAAAIARGEFAAASKARYAREKEERLKWNAVLAERVKEAQDWDGPRAAAGLFRQAEEEAVLWRGSDVRTSTFINYQAYVENKLEGEEQRRLRDTRTARRAKQEATYMSRAQDLSMKGAKQQQLVRRVHSDQAKMNLDNTRAMRDTLHRREARQRRDRERELAAAKARVVIARGLDAKLDAQEEAVDAQERQEGSQMRNALLNQINDMRTEELSAKRQSATDTREATRQGIQDAWAQARGAATELARRKRDEASAGRKIQAANEKAYMRQAQQHRDAAMTTRAGIRATAAALREKRQDDADMIRQDPFDDPENIARRVAARKQHIAKSYAARFVSAEDGADFKGSPLYRLHMAARRAMNAVASALSPSSPAEQAL